MSCCSLKVLGSNPVLGNFFNFFFHRGGAKGARHRILKTIGLSSGIFFDAFKAFFKTRTQIFGSTRLREGCLINKIFLGKHKICHFSRKSFKIL